MDQDKLKDMCKVLEKLDRANVIDAASSWLWDRLKVILATCINRNAKTGRRSCNETKRVYFARSTY